MDYNNNIIYNKPKNIEGMTGIVKAKFIIIIILFKIITHLIN